MSARKNNEKAQHDCTEGRKGRRDFIFKMPGWVGSASMQTQPYPHGLRTQHLNVLM